MQAARKLDSQTTAMMDTPKQRSPLLRAIAYLAQHRRATLIAYGALLVATAAQLVVPLLVRNMINAITEGFAARQVLAVTDTAQQADMLQAMGTTLDAAQRDFNGAEALLINGALLVMAFAAFRGLFAFVQAYMAEWTSQGVAYSLRNDIFTRIQRLSFSYYDRQQTGQLMIRATDDVERVRVFIAQGLILAVQAVLLLMATLTILFLINWQLTLTILPILPVAFVLFMSFGRLAQPLFGEVQRRLSKLNTVLQENVAGIRVVKAFVRQPHEQGRFDRANDELFNQWMRIARVFSALFPLIFLVGQIGQAVIVYFAGRQIINGDLLLGDYQLFSLYLVYVFFPIGQLGIIITLMAQASASSERIFEILDAESDVKEKPDALTLPTIAGHVAFEDVTFAYFNSSAPVLKNVSFTVAAGQTVALLGSTGSGKTTIINLIPRFYDVTGGRITVDGVDLRDVTLDSLRSQIGIVLQETNLFSGTIQENIAFGRPDATLEEVMAAAQAAAAHDFIMGFPNGYETSVGERGATLSGGQKQRIAIARALLLRPHILIMDDSTSSVDFATERQIQAALATLMQGRTSFVIAQRISTARNADLIIVLDKGEVAAMGTHSELLETSPIYAEIFNSQLVDDSETLAEEA